MLLNKKSATDLTLLKKKKKCRVTVYQLRLLLALFFYWFKKIIKKKKGCVLLLCLNASPPSNLISLSFFLFFFTENTHLLIMSLHYGAGSLKEEIPILEEETKRHSRSLDLSSTTRISSVRHLHQRSASESDGFIKNEAVLPTALPQQPQGGSVFSIYKKLGSSFNNTPKAPEFISKRSKSRSSIGSAFANFRQPSFTSSKKSSHRHSCMPMNTNSTGKKIILYYYVKHIVSNSFYIEVMDTITKYNTINEEHHPIPLQDQRGESK